MGLLYMGFLMNFEWWVCWKGFLWLKRCGVKKIVCYLNIIFIIVVVFKYFVVKFFGEVGCCFVILGY